MHLSSRWGLIYLLRVVLVFSGLGCPVPRLIFFGLAVLLLVALSIYPTPLLFTGHYCRLLFSIVLGLHV